MKVLIILDPFKNVLSAEAAGFVWREGISVHDPNPQVEINPIVDGWDGSLKLHIKYSGAELMSSAVLDPIGRTFDDQWGFNLETHTDIIELA